MATCQGFPGLCFSATRHLQWILTYLALLSYDFHRDCFPETSEQGSCPDQIIVWSPSTKQVNNNICLNNLLTRRGQVDGSEALDQHIATSQTGWYTSNQPVKFVYYSSMNTMLVWVRGIHELGLTFNSPYDWHTNVEPKNFITDWQNTRIFMEP